MELVFLSNGQACYLKEKIGSKYIVNKVFEYEDEENGWQEVQDANDIVVDAIFKKPPVEKIDAEIKELQLKKKQTLSEISELESKKRTVKNEVEQITKTQVSNSKFIINRSDLINAKRLALFMKDRPLPKLMDSTNKSFRGLKVSLTVEISTGLERSWGYSLYYDYDGSSDYLCEKYGILINPTQEEVDAMIVKRLSEFKFSDHWMKSVDDKYLTADQLKQKNEYLESERVKEKEKLEKQILETKEKLSKLQSANTCL